MLEGKGIHFAFGVMAVIVAVLYAVPKAAAWISGTIPGRILLFTTVFLLGCHHIVAAVGALLVVVLCFAIARRYHNNPMADMPPPTTAKESADARIANSLDVEIAKHGAPLNTAPAATTAPL